MLLGFHFLLIRKCLFGVHYFLFFQNLCLCLALGKKLGFIEANLKKQLHIYKFADLSRVHGTCALDPNILEKCHPGTDNRRRGPAARDMVPEEESNLKDRQYGLCSRSQKQFCRCLSPETGKISRWGPQNIGGWETRGVQA